MSRTERAIVILCFFLPHPTVLVIFPLSSLPFSSIPSLFSANCPRIERGYPIPSPPFSCQLLVHRERIPWPWLFSFILHAFFPIPSPCSASCSCIERGYPGFRNFSLFSLPFSSIPTLFFSASYLCIERGYPVPSPALSPVKAEGLPLPHVPATWAAGSFRHTARVPGYPGAPVAHVLLILSS